MIPLLKANTWVYPLGVCNSTKLFPLASLGGKREVLVGAAFFSLKQNYKIPRVLLPGSAD